MASARSPSNSRAWCERLGAHAVVDHFGDMKAGIATLGLAAPDLVLLLNDPDRHYLALADLLAPQGTICSAVPFERPPDLNLIMRKSAALVWEFMFTRSMFRTPDMCKQGEILNRIADLVDEGRIVSTQTDILGPINAVTLRAAHARLEQGRTVGKLVLAGF